MADGYWNQQRQKQHPPPIIPPGGRLKRPRSGFETPGSAIPSGREIHNYLPRDEDHLSFQSVKDSNTIGSAYDRYLQSMQMPSVPSGEAGPFNGVGMGIPGRGNTVTDPSMGEPTMGQFNGVVRSSHDILPLPPDASNTLYVEGLPSNCSRREVAHIFRPFVGYKEVRLVTKESKLRNGDPVVLCFVDFINPACAATALSALRGYRMDETDPESKFLRLQFSRKPGPRPGARGRS
ncbi:PREDICTED: nuclear speckle RNA-binding protein A-like [Tarenaya hassleriana]|uniref:nuclear speckle RNA-binding protein A-like n=1 Tax=Tarenaya hassleriana TaxID=28532 RepID=UPI00053C7BB9|nr:PREDICTED: nuclear speckle RNA-binding protein A-like [Tarenaya hassleriana]XP_010539724.1 PREDICTED: nuclear speckle RNA-binding protein A-like [Tarenaya hassleriana]